MEETLVLKAQIREKVGSRLTAKIREAGNIPGSVYGHKQEPVSVVFNGHDFMESLRHSHSRLAEVEMGGKKETVILKEFQYDYLGKNIIHVDLMRVDANETIEVNVPLVFKGEPKGATEGGILEEHAGEVMVECRVSEMPDSIVVSVKDLGIGQNIHAADLKMPAGVKLISSPELLIVACSVVAAAKAVEGEEAEEVKEPEVIGGKKAEETEE